MDKNEVYVTTDLQDERLWHKDLHLTNIHWINGEPAKQDGLAVRARYRAPLVRVESLAKTDRGWTLQLDEDIRAITPGQSAVLYDGEHCLGGGIVSA